MLLILPLGKNGNSVSLTYWKDKNVLITGHTGFKGTWLTLWLLRLGANVTGISLKPDTDPNLYDLLNLCSQHNLKSNYCNINDLNSLSSIIKHLDVDHLFHLAAQPLVRESYKHPLETFSHNIIGTANILNCARNFHNLKSIVVITTDKVYEPVSNQVFYKESDALGGYDPYSSSKAAAEIIVESYKRSFFNELNIPIATARAGNVIGGGDWSKDRLVPDLIKAWSKGEIAIIRNPNFIRPWQHVLDPLMGYLHLSKTIASQPGLASPYNFGPENESSTTVIEIVKQCMEIFNSAEYEIRQNMSDPHEASTLNLDIAKAKKDLNFYPKLPLSKTISMTINWYKRFYNGEDPMTLCIEDIDSYLNEKI